MIEFIYAAGQTVFGILTVLVAVVLTLALGFGILAGLGRRWDRVNILNALKTRGPR